MRNRVKLLFIVPSVSSSGPTTLVLNILKHLDTTIFDPSVLTLSPESGASARQQFDTLGVHIYSLDMSRARGIIFGKQALSKLINERGFDIVHAHGLRPDYLASAVADKIPVVSTIHNELYADYCMTYNRLQGRLMARMHRKALARIPAVVACSESVADSLKELGLSPSVIRVGVDTDKFHPASDEDKAALRESLGIPADSKVIVVVGELCYRKDPLTIIDGFMMSSLSQNGILIFLGGGPMTAECISRAGQADGRIVIAGHVPNVQDYLRVSDCLVSASKAEGLPSAVIEAMACGIPACLSAIPPHYEIRSLNLLSCEVFDVGNAHGLASKLDEMMSESLQDRAAAARAIVEEHLCAKRMSREYQELYLTLLGRQDDSYEFNDGPREYDEPKVTVGIPFYSATKPEDLRSAVDSVTAQSHRPYEIHLIQDGPVCEELRLLAEEYVKKDTRFKLIGIQKNMGLAHALNRSVRETETPYYARMDSDDVSLPDRLKRQVEYLQSNPDIEIVGTWANEYYDDAGRHKSIRKTPLTLGGIARRFHYRNPMIHATIMFRMAVFDKIGIYDPRFPLCKDYQLWGRAIKAGIGMANIPEALYDINAATMIQRRAPIRMFLVQLRTRFTYNTWSPTLNAVKIAFLLFMLMPRFVKTWVYNRSHGCKLVHSLYTRVPNGSIESVKEPSAMTLNERVVSQGSPATPVVIVPSGGTESDGTL